MLQGNLNFLSGLFLFLSENNLNLTTGLSMISGYQDINPQDKNQKKTTLFEKYFIAFLKDVFMGLPYYILNFSALTA